MPELACCAARQEAAATHGRSWLGYSVGHPFTTPESKGHARSQAQRLVVLQVQAIPCRQSRRHWAKGRPVRLTRSSLSTLSLGASRRV